MSRNVFLAEFGIGTEEVGCWFYSGHIFVAVLSVSSIALELSYTFFFVDSNSFRHIAEHQRTGGKGTPRSHYGVGHTDDGITGYNPNPNGRNEYHVSQTGGSLCILRGYTF